MIIKFIYDSSLSGRGYGYLDLNSVILFFFFLQVLMTDRNGYYHLKVQDPVEACYKLINQRKTDFIILF